MDAKDYKNSMHFLMTEVEYFDAVVAGVKRFEVRRNDRDFKVGDVLILAKYDPATCRILPGYVCVKITYMLVDFPGIKRGYVVLGFINSFDATQQIKDYYMFQLVNQQSVAQDSARLN